MLETIREFGREQLVEAAELEATSDAHARRFAELVEAAEPHLTAGREWPDRLENDHANIRAAVTWLAERDMASALMMAGRLWRFWHLRDHLREGAAVLSALLADPRASEPNSARAKALIGLAGLVYWQSDYELARTSYEEALAIARANGDQQLEVETLYSLAYVRAIEKDWDGADRDFEAARALYETEGNELMAMWAIESRGMVATLAGRHTDALPLLEETFNWFEVRGETFGMRNAVAVEARALMHLGRLEDARELNKRGLELALAGDDMTSLSAMLHDSASLAALAGDLERAAILTGAAQRIVAESGAQPPPELVNRVEALPTLERELDPARLAGLISDGRRLSADQATDLALSDWGPRRSDRRSRPPLDSGL